jgi:TPR repeat protein
MRVVLRALIVVGTGTLAASATAQTSPDIQALDAARAVYYHGDRAESARLLQPLAERGLPEAQALMGLLHLEGQGDVGRDPDQARALCSAAAERGDPTGERCLGRMHLMGIGFNSSANAAWDWFQRAAEHDDAYAHVELVMRIMQGHFGTSAALDAEAARWARRAADSGNAMAAGTLGMLHLMGRGVPQDDHEARRLFTIAAQGGEASFQHALGTQLLFGYGGPPDYAGAMRWLMAAYEGGARDAALELAVAYLQGVGTARDDAAAFVWMRRAAEARVATAELGLARMYRDAQGTPRDDAQAVRWFRAAMQSTPDSSAVTQHLGCLNAGRITGDPCDSTESQAEADLAFMHLVGRGTPADPAEAFRLFRHAASLGNASAQQALGTLHLCGIGTPVDLAESRRWFLTAAERNDRVAMRILGQMNEQGVGFPRNRAAALQWYRRAGAAGDEEARAAVIRLTSAESEASPAPGDQSPPDPAPTDVRRRFSCTLGGESTL